MEIKPLIYIVFLVLVVSGIRILYQYGDVLSDDKYLFQDEMGFPYIQDADSYHYYHKANIGELDNGLSWFAFYWDKFLKMFNPNITLMGSMGVLSLLFFGLTVLNVFFIVYVVTKSYTAGFFGGLILSLNSQIFLGTLNADTNTLIYFFTTSIVLFFFLLIKKEKTLDKSAIIWKAIYAVILFLLLIAFKFTWEGWYFILFVLAFSIVVHTIINFCLEKEITYTKLFITLFFLAVSGLITFIKWPFKTYIFSSLKHSAGLSTINELYEYGLLILLIIDNALLVICTILFSIYVVYKRKDLISYFLVVWFFLMIYAASQAFRFVYFAILVFSILAGVMLWELYKSLEKHLKIPTRTTFFLIFLILFFTNDYTSNREFLVDDSVYSLNEVYIPSTAHIINHWDNGYIIKAFSKKYVRFEGLPSTNELFKEAIVNTNESKSVLEFKGAVGKDPYIILTKHDYNVLNFQYKITEDSILTKLMEESSESFELYYEAETTYNWIRIWRLKQNGTG